MLSMDRIKQMCAAYVGTTGVSMLVIDDTGRNVDFLGEQCPSPFCAIIQRDLGRGEECRLAHVYGSYQAERFGESYIFFCPFGLVHWVAPIVDGYQRAYSLVAGPVLMTSSEEALIDQLLLQNRFTGGDIDRLRGTLDQIPYVPPRTVSDMALVLWSLACYLSNPASVEALEERHEYSSQQAAIAEVIHERKQGEGLPINYPIDQEKKLLAKIRLGDKQGAQTLLNEILGHIFFSRGNDIKFIKGRVLELVVLLSRAALEGGARDDVVLGLNREYLNQLEALTSADDIAFWLSKVMTRFTDYVFDMTGVKNIDIIYKAVSYIRDNYMSDITVEDVAEAVGLSPSYFSQLFNDEMKCSFRSFLNRIRIENSKPFLLDDSIPLVTVAAKVGFQDQSYFGKVFKRLVGVSPGEFRKSRGTIPSSNL
ncbi:MAG: helix-turn-helix domain-containing protein [Firmicutes bacterium]|nr:helix-turn-helix domain-containing protein [Bacillota bacterium]